jgi:hypothetical protein
MLIDIVGRVIGVLCSRGCGRDAVLLQRTETPAYVLERVLCCECWEASRVRAIKNGVPRFRMGPRLAELGVLPVVDQADRRRRRRLEQSRANQARREADPRKAERDRRRAAEYRKRNREAINQWHREYYWRGKSKPRNREEGNRGPGGVGA